MHALAFASSTLILCRNYTEAESLLKELVALADEKGASYWKAWGSVSQGWLLVLTGKAWDAIQIIAMGIAAYQSTGAKIYVPLYLSYLARAHAEAGQIDEALALPRRSDDCNRNDQGNDGAKPKSIASRAKSR